MCDESTVVLSQSKWLSRAMYTNASVSMQKYQPMPSSQRRNHFASIVFFTPSPSPANPKMLVKHLSDNTVEARLEPLDGLVTVDLVGGTDSALGAAAAGDALTRTGHAAVEVHTVDTDGGVVLDTEIDVLGDTESEVAGLREVALAELVLLDLEATLENLLGLGATDGDVDSDLLVTADTEGTDGVAGLACEGSLIRSMRYRKFGERSVTYCRRGSDQTAARAPWRHE
jgi:hypothetical protein